jgi:hypothetical protein
MNLFSPLADSAAAERVDALLITPGLRHRADRFAGPGEPARLLVRPGGRRMGAAARRRRTVALRRRDRCSPSLARRLARHRSAPPPPGRVDRPDGHDPVAGGVLSGVASSPVNLGETGRKTDSALKTAASTAKTLSLSTICGYHPVCSCRGLFGRSQGGKSGYQGGNRGGKIAALELPN